MVMPATDVRERVIAYVKHNAAKDPNEIRDVVRKGHDHLVGLLEDMTDAQARWKPDAEAWPVLEVLQHVIASKHGTARLCAALARGDELSGQAALGDAGKELSSLADARSELADAHRGLLDFVATVSPATNLEASFDHPWFGPHNCREWAVFQRVHDGDHIAQIEQIKASPGFPA